MKNMMIATAKWFCNCPLYLRSADCVVKLGLLIVVCCCWRTSLPSQVLVLDFQFEQSTLPTINELNGVFSINGTLNGPTWVGGTNVNTYQQECLVAGNGGWGLSYSGWNPGEAFVFTFSTLGKTNLILEMCKRTPHPGVSNFGTMVFWGFDGTAWEQLGGSWTVTGGWDGSWGALPANFENKPSVTIEMRKLSTSASASYSLEIDNFQIYTLTSLPVSLLSFNAVETANGNQIQWTTAAESERCSFTVERSADGYTNWDAVDTIPCTGTDTGNKDYNLMDSEPLSTSWYRLRQTDADGSFSYSKLAVVVQKDRYGFVVKPNPARQLLQLQVNNFIPDRICIVDHFGRKVLDKVYETNEMDISALPVGVYGVVLYSGTALVQQQFVKQ